MLVAASLDQETREKLSIDDDLNDFARAGIKRLEGMYKSGQGIPLWPDKEAKPWLTVYTTWALLRARAMTDIDVPETFLSGLLDILERDGVA